ncbi:hypothetical protein KZX46_01515 (plasmid) [Polymorphobacter sp. PAMC 29334]|uniref:hypothetical protein n=1 Tax=Polymorphobacter sp. PAMC 29334 TaxID=2862331 RepID=UPI001C74FDF2|nr:hypothetical protein [Polymorphobacter sp. PAMC 29334]QYE33479.1 hypothetical protein KZX46_01515 [Polymorphobacter sp. PAMC 29334]
MAALLALAYAVGVVIRFNIVHVEDHAATLTLNDPFAWAMRVGQFLLAIAYSVSVAYYLKLLAEFVLKSVPFPVSHHAIVANVLVSLIIVALTLLTYSGELKRIEHAAHATVAVKLGIIAGLLTGLAVWWASHAAASLDLPPAKVSLTSIPLLLGLLITVQGFETSRYLGESYDQATRVRTMRYAQLLSSAIYLAFLGLLTPFLQQATHAEGVAGILDIMALVAPIMGVFVLVGAVFSQLSAAIADSIGSGGLIIEVSRRKLGVRTAFLVANALTISVVWLTDPFEVIALSSRAFALFYAVQAGLAVWVSRRTRAGSALLQSGFALVGLICIVAALVGAPAGG